VVDSGKFANFGSVLMEQGLGEEGRKDEMKYDQLHYEKNSGKNHSPIMVS